MRAILVLISFSFLILSTSCERTPGIFATSEQQILGTWEYQRVTYRERNDLYAMGQLERYQYDRVTFNRNRTVEILNTRTGNIEVGSWRINVYFEWDGNNNDRVEELELTFQDENGQTYVQYWDDLFVSYSRIRGKERLPDGVWTYVLTSISR